MYLLYVNDSEAAFSAMIVGGMKEWESRNRNTLGRLLCHRVLIVRTGNGDPAIVGSAFMDAWDCIDTPERWDGGKSALVEGTSFAEFNGKKYVYHFINPEMLHEPIPLKVYLDHHQVISKNRSYITVKEGWI